MTGPLLSYRLADEKQNLHVAQPMAHRAQGTRSSMSSELSCSSGSTSSTASSELSDPDATLHFLRQTYGHATASRDIDARSGVKAGMDHAAWFCLMACSVDGHDPQQYNGLLHIE